ncbi:MAG: NAD(P)H-binding protein [Candidatus Sumerlaeia bacterium]
MIFVTGGTSHTGRRVVRCLLARAPDEEVRCLVRDAARAAAGGLAPSNGCPLTLIEGDIEAPDTYAGAMRGARAVINVAHIRYGPQLADLCLSLGVGRLVCLSSTRRYTRWPDEAAHQVIAAETALERMDLDWTILRATMIYGGPEDNNIEKLVQLIRRWHVILLPGGGRNLVQPVFVGDLAETVVAVVSLSTSFRRAYTLAGPEPMSYRTMLQQIAAALGRRIILVPVPIGPAVAAALAAQTLGLPWPATPDQIRRLGEDKAFDISQARRDLGFSPRSFQEGLRAKLEGKA